MWSRCSFTSDWLRWCSGEWLASYNLHFTSMCGVSMPKARNVLNAPLRTCGTDPVTGFYRNGCCDTGAGDSGIHVVCAEVTAEFLAFSASRGNDLSTPVP